jgi:stress response protein YsnF
LLETRLPSERFQPALCVLGVSEFPVVPSTGSDSNRRNSSLAGLLVNSPAENIVSDEEERRVPVVEERARIEKRVVERKVVRIRTATTESQQILSDTVRVEEVNIRRVPVNREIDAVPEVRQEGDEIVIPVVEERAVLVKQLVLVEELHVQRKVVQQDVELPVRLHSTEVFVETENSPQGEQT